VVADTSGRVMALRETRDIPGLPTQLSYGDRVEDEHDEEEKTCEVRNDRPYKSRYIIYIKFVLNVRYATSVIESTSAQGVSC
jgi:hypothetical protein